LRPGGANPGRTYRWFNGAVQPFGTGLHYTTFDAKFASNGTVTYDIAAIMGNCTNQYPDTCTISSIPVTITNIGNRTSDFVALTFIKGEVGPAPYPLKTLISYTRVRDVKGSQTKSAEMQLTLGNLARVDEMGNTVLYPGEYTVLLDEPTNAQIKVVVKGEETVLDKWPQPPADRR
jgi:beta-D-xylosidase 4